MRAGASPPRKRAKTQASRAPPCTYVHIDPSSSDLPDMAAFMPKEEDTGLEPRFSLDLLAMDQPGTPRPGTPSGRGNLLRQYKALCELLLPAMRTQSHLTQLIYRCPWSMSLVLREHGVVIGGTTFRVIKSTTPPVLILDVLLLAVDQRPGVCGRGYGTRLTNYMKALVLKLAARANAGAVMLTQADEGGVANTFWARQRLRSTPQAHMLLKALHEWDTANDLYTHSIPMMVWLQQKTAKITATTSARAQEMATERHVLNHRHTRHTPMVCLRLRGAWTLYPPIEKEPEETNAPVLGLVLQTAGSCSKCGGSHGVLLPCRSCCQLFHAGCAAAPRSSEARACTKMYGAAADAYAQLYPHLFGPHVLQRPQTVTCGACAALIASGGAEDGSGCVSLGRKASRLNCEDAVSELCAQSEAWREWKRSEAAPATPAAVAKQPATPLPPNARSSPRFRG